MVWPQVYKGRLHTGEVVAVKVQRPGIADNIAVDMLLLRRLMKIVDQNTSEVRTSATAVLAGWTQWGSQERTVEVAGTASPPLPAGDTRPGTSC